MDLHLTDRRALVTGPRRVSAAPSRRRWPRRAATCCWSPATAPPSQSPRETMLRGRAMIRADPSQAAGIVLKWEIHSLAYWSAKAAAGA